MPEPYIISVQKSKPILHTETLICQLFCERNSAKIVKNILEISAVIL